jgi:hypothetical protein
VVGVKRWKRDITVIVATGLEDCYFLPEVPKSSEFEIGFEVRGYYSILQRQK